MSPLEDARWLVARLHDTEGVEQCGIDEDDPEQPVVFATVCVRAAHRFKAETAATAIAATEVGYLSLPTRVSRVLGPNEDVPDVLPKLHDYEDDDDEDEGNDDDT